MNQVFAQPGLLFALLALPVVSVLTILASRRQQRYLVQMAGLVGAVLLAGQRPTFLSRLALSLGLTCLVIGIAGPRWGRDWSLAAAPGRDLIVVVDLSRSMYAEAPSRIERTCLALDDLVATLRLRGGHRLGLVVFAGKPRLLCPLTHDLDHLREAIASIDLLVPDTTLGNGTRIGSALTLAIDSFDGRSAQAREILLLSDGDDPARDGEWGQGAERARSEGVPIHCIGIGDPGEGHRIPVGDNWLTDEGKEVRTRLEESPLRAVAQRTGGQLLLAGPKPLPLGEYYRSLSAHGRGEDSPDALPVFKQRQRWFLVPAFILLTLVLVIPGRKGRR